MERYFPSICGLLAFKFSPAGSRVFNLTRGVLYYKKEEHEFRSRPKVSIISLSVCVTNCSTPSKLYETSSVGNETFCSLPYHCICFFLSPRCLCRTNWCLSCKAFKNKKKVMFAQYYNSYDSYFLNIMRCFCFFILLFFYVIIIIIVINRIKVGRDLGITYVYLFCFGSF